MVACINTRVHMDACILYMRPFGYVYILHVSKWTRVLNTHGHLFLIKYILIKIHVINKNI
jgi:hypothetical protein